MKKRKSQKEIWMEKGDFEKMEKLSKRKKRMGKTREKEEVTKT